MREFLPGAEMVFDKFHVVKLANEAQDKVRRREMKVWPKGLKRMRYILSNCINFMIPDVWKS